MSAYTPPYVVNANPVPSQTSWTAIFALIIAVIAIIIVIVVVYIVTTDSQLVTNRTAQWGVTAGTAAAAQTFIASPNSIFVVPTTAAASGYTITIQPYANLATFVTSSETTVFRIDNSQNANSVLVAGQTVASAGVSNPATIPPRSVFEYHWVNSTTIKLIGWSISI